MCQSRERCENLDPCGSGTDTWLRYVSVAVQTLHGCSGQEVERECIGLTFGVVRSKSAELTVESVHVCYWSHK